MAKKYSSKISYGLLVVLFIVFFSPIIINLIIDGVYKALVLLLLFLIIVYVFILHMFFKTEYLIEESQLQVRCGFFTYKPINILNIKEISKSTNIISSPAASFDRIEIKYGKFEELIISPKNKIQFAKDLMFINPNIKNNLA